jgi:flagellar biosynthesis protein FlhG
MPDQAEKLREMVGGAADFAVADTALPPMIVVSGGKGGVGTTTVALNLAAALSHGGHRTVLVDAAPHADAGHLAGIDDSDGPCLADVVAGACDTAQALRCGPAGALLLSGRWAADIAPNRSMQACDRLLRQLAALDTSVDALVIDGGSGATNWTRLFWQRATLVLVVTTPDDVAIMDAYATLKRGLADDVTADVRVLMNQCDSTTAAADAQRRIAMACQRFLGRTIGRAPRLPREADDSHRQLRVPRAWDMLSSPFGRSVRQLGRFVADVLAQQRRESQTPSIECAHECEFSTC